MVNYFIEESYGEVLKTFLFPGFTRFIHINISLGVVILFLIKL